MTAPREAVEAVQKALGCERWKPGSAPAQCWKHLGEFDAAPWTDRGCPVAVAAAEAAVAPGPDWDASAFDRVNQHPAQSLNAIAEAVTDVMGFVPLDVRYATAVEALESLPARIPEHLQGDGPCSRCGGPVVSGWFTDSVFWNNVVRSAPLPWMADGDHPDGDGLLCFECFVRLTHERGYRPTGWHISPEWPWRREPPTQETQ